LKKIETKKWDVEFEESNRVNLPANDCRRFNGGSVAPPEITKFWPKENEIPKDPVITEVTVIDRLQ
jgi:hypothetical protein